MRIAHVTVTFPPYYAGTGNVCYHNARLLAALGHEVVVYTAKLNGEVSKTVHGFKIERLPYLLRVGNALLLPRLLQLSHYDLVHLHYPFIFGAEMIWLSRQLRGQPYVLTYHNDLRGHGIRGLIFAVYRRVWAKAVLNGAERVIVTTWDYALTNSQLRPLIQSDPSCVVEVPNGVDTALFSPNVNGGEIRKKHDIKPNFHHVVLFAGAMDAAHHLKGGLPQLLKAIACLGNPNIVLLLVGGGEKIPAYAALARELGIGEQTKFAGWISCEAMGQYYAAADIVVQPSVLFEPFGMVAIEAMACGKPVIASNLPGVRSVVSDGEDGLLVRPGDVEDLAEKIQMLLDDPQRRREMGERGRDKVEEKYAWPKIIPRLVRVYEEVLANATADG
jgi:glycosyltransferase involved in cell wall biosynthesis